MGRDGRLEVVPVAANKVEMERARRRLRSSINALFGEVV
jgi:hypothetical protein